jgi:hypothetical protein
MNTGLVMKSGSKVLMHPDFFILAAKFARSGYVNFITKKVRYNLCYTLTQKKSGRIISLHIFDQRNIG